MPGHRHLPLGGGPSAAAHRDPVAIARVATGMARAGRRAGVARYRERVADEDAQQGTQHVRWTDQPGVRSPILVLAFAGWSDAGDAATAAVRFLAERWDARPFANIDPEPFFDFTTTRPLVSFDDRGRRQITWPDSELSAARVPGTEVDVVTMVGIEPQLRWRTFTDQVVALARQLGTRLVVTLGALLADVPHNRPVTVFGLDENHDGIRRLGLLPSRYEGPTGITSVIQVACRQAGIPAVSLWAAVPSYVPVAPSPKAALALVEQAARLLDVPVDTDELSQAADDYEHEVSDLVDRDDETAEYVRQLEESYDEEEPRLFSDGPSLVEEVERYLRDQD